MSSTPKPDKYFDADALASTTEADKYRAYHRVSYTTPTRAAHTTIHVLPKLAGRAWDQYALNMLAACRPSYVRVTKYDEGVTCDSVEWRVTVVLGDDDRTILRIMQEVRVGCVGALHGYGLNRYARGESPEIRRNEHGIAIL